MNKFRIDPKATIGAVALTVADLKTSVAFYTDLIGFKLLSQDAASAVLGVDRPLLRLQEQSGAQPWPRTGRSYTGLYHFAVLVPTRVDLGLWLTHWLSSGQSLPGQGDHRVSEALYLEDPDGHGIEIYRDRPRSEWVWTDGRVQMASDPVDIRGLLEEAKASGQSWLGLPSETRIGHIHLQVGNIADTEDFYQDALGFAVVASLPQALFLSAGGYHHHIGANTWHSGNASPAPENTVRLRQFDILLPDQSALDRTVQIAESRGVKTRAGNGGFSIADPWGNELLLKSDSSRDRNAG